MQNSKGKWTPTAIELTFQPRGRSGGVRAWRIERRKVDSQSGFDLPEKPGGAKQCPKVLVTIQPLHVKVSKKTFVRQFSGSWESDASQLRKIGRPTGEVDTMIAAVAIVHKAELITGNTRHFEHIEGLKLTSW